MDAGMIPSVRKAFVLLNLAPWHPCRWFLIMAIPLADAVVPDMTVGIIVPTSWRSIRFLSADGGGNAWGSWWHAKLLNFHLGWFTKPCDLWCSKSEILQLQLIWTCSLWNMFFWIPQTLSTKHLIPSLLWRLQTLSPKHTIPSKELEKWVGPVNRLYLASCPGNIFLDNYFIHGSWPHVNESMGVPFSFASGSIYAYDRIRYGLITRSRRTCRCQSLKWFSPIRRMAAPGSTFFPRSVAD